MKIRAVVISIMIAGASAACTPQEILVGQPPEDSNPDTPDGPGGDDPGNPGTPGDPQKPDSPVASTGGALIWKRYRAFERDLARALELSPDALCRELGSLNCIDDVHLSSLGGHDPFRQGGRQTSLDEPALTTPIAVDRVVLSACIERVEQDTANTPRVFTRYPLSGAAGNDPDDRAAFDAQNQALYRRFLARDPTEAELSVMQELWAADTPLRDVAISSCYVIGTSVEFLFL